MKICMLLSTPFPPKEGIGYHTYYLSKKLIEKGHKVVVITRGSWRKTQKEIFEGIEVIRVPFIPLYPFYMKLHGFFVNKTFKSIESEIDILHYQTPLPPLIKTSKPTIITIHTPMLTDNKYYTRIRSLYSFLSKISARFVSYPLELKLIRSANIVTTVSSSVANELIEYNMKPENVIVIGNGVDEKSFKAKAKKSENSSKYVLFAGRIDREKGLFDLIECGKYIFEGKSDIDFIIAGKGRDLNKLKRKTKKMGIQDKYKFLGQVDKDELVKLYQNASIFVLPSYHEGLPGVLLEAMACSMPIIASDVRGNRDLISNDFNGIIVPPRDPKKLAKAILKLTKDKKLGYKYGKNARKTIEEKYTWNRISYKILKCYKSLVEA